VAAFPPGAVFLPGFPLFAALAVEVAMSDMLLDSINT